MLYGYTYTICHGCCKDIHILYVTDAVWIYMLHITDGNCSGKLQKIIIADHCNLWLLTKAY